MSKRLRIGSTMLKNKVGGRISHDFKTLLNQDRVVLANNSQIHEWN